MRLAEVETEEDLDEAQDDIPMRVLDPKLLAKIRAFRMRVASSLVELKKLALESESVPEGLSAVEAQMEAVDDYFQQALRASTVGQARKYIRLGTIAHEQALTMAFRERNGWFKNWLYSSWRGFRQSTNQAPYFWGQQTFRWIITGMNVAFVLASPFLGTYLGRHRF